MATPNLNIDHITASQNNKETTANAAFDALDNAMNSGLTKDGTGDITLTSEEFRTCQFIKLTGVHSSAFELYVPAGIKKIFSVQNFYTTTKAVTVLTTDPGSNGVTFAEDATAFFYTDGVDVFLLGSSLQAVDLTYDMPFYFPGVPDGDQVMTRFAVATDFDLPADFTGSIFKAGTASIGVVEFSIRKNGTQIGTVRFTNSANGVASSSGASFIAGDILSIVADTYADINVLRDVSMTLVGMRT